MKPQKILQTILFLNTLESLGGKGGVIAQLVLGTYLMFREHSQQNNDRRMDYFCTHI